MNDIPAGNTLAARVVRTLSQRRAGFELADGDIAIEGNITRRQVHLNLEPYVSSGTLAQRVDHGIYHYSLPAQPGAPGNGNAAATPTTTPTPTAFDPNTVQPKAFVSMPKRNGWSQRAADCHAILNKLTAPGLFIDGIPKHYGNSLKRQAYARSYMGPARYAFHKPTPDTIAIYRIADAPQPLPAPATSTHKALVRKAKKP